MKTLRVLILCLSATAACTEATGDGATGDGATGPAQTADPNEVAIDVPATGRAFLNLATRKSVTPADDGKSSTDWDLAFSGLDVFTNSGLSGPADGGAFPLDFEDYETGNVPTIPFLIEDDAGGAFVRWYAYDPGEHVIYSRFHVFGVHSGDTYFKVQLYGFYGEVQGAPVSALYSLKYAEVTSNGPASPIELTDVDASAGGSEARDSAPSACLDLDAKKTLMLTPADAAENKTWDLCFRRAEVRVNGELGGPGGVGTADLDALETDSETLDEVKKRTKAGAASRFDGIGYAELTDKTVPYHGDRVLTAFSDKWALPGSSPPAPAKIAWLIQAADGVTRYVATFARFEQPTETTPGRVVMLLKRVE